MLTATFWTIFKYRASTRAISIVLPKRRAKVQFHRNAYNRIFTGCWSLHFTYSARPPKNWGNHFLIKLKAGWALLSNVNSIACWSLLCQSAESAVGYAHHVFCFLLSWQNLKEEEGVRVLPQCLKITQNIAFSKTRQIEHFCHFNELLSTLNVNVARFARNV